MYDVAVSPTVAKWVGEHLDVDFGDNCAAVGICEGDTPIAGVVYTNSIVGPAGPQSVEMHIASISPRWANRKTLRLFFGFAFVNLNVSRVTAFTTKKNRPARSLLDRLGFVYEGKMREAYSTGDDAMIYGMLRHECRWL